MNWPNDADGDVLRRLKAKGFNFEREVGIDFNIDFDVWPPDISLTSILASRWPSAKISIEENYILVQVRARVTHPFVTNMQADLTAISVPFGGRCESWGVLWDHPRDQS